MRENNIKGWMSVEELDFLYDAALEMKSIVELGSYLGRSTVALAEGCKGGIFAVDHWNWTEGLGLEMDGTEYEQFKENTKDFNNIIVLKVTTQEASKHFAKVDMVFIDADHRYEAVKQDIETWLPRTHILLCGHDYDEEGVKKAVDELIDIDSVVGSIWYKWL